MRTKMPDVIDAYIRAANSRDADRFGSLFSEDAIVHGEGQEYRGIVATWHRSTSPGGTRDTAIATHLPKPYTVEPAPAVRRVWFGSGLLRRQTGRGRHPAR